MSRESVFNESSVLKALKLTVQDQEIPQDDIQSCEVRYDMFRTFIEAVFIIRDTFNLKSSKLLEMNGNIKIKFSVTDYTREIWLNTFIVQDAQIMPQNRETYIVFHCIDEASHKMLKFHKSLFGRNSICDEFMKQVSATGVSSVLSANKKQTKQSGTDHPRTIPWNIPGNQGYLEFFGDYLQTEFAFLYQTHYEYRVGKINVNDLQMMEHEYTTDATNTHHLFKIHDHKIKEPSKITIPALKVMRLEGKEITTETVSVDNLAGQIVLNGNADAFKEAQDPGGPMDLPTSKELGTQLSELFMQMLRLNQLSIWTVGSLKYGDIGQRVKVKIGADTVSNKDHLQGNQTASGIYVVTGLSDLFAGGKFIQKHMLSRFDNPKVV